MRRRKGHSQGALDAGTVDLVHLTWICFHSNPNTALRIPTLPVPSSALSLTMAAVFAPKANRTEAGVGPPADRAGATVLAGAGVTERVLGMTTWRYQSLLYQPQPAHHLPPAQMERHHCFLAFSLAVRGASPAAQCLHTDSACSGMGVKAVGTPYARTKILQSWTDDLVSPMSVSSTGSALGSGDIPRTLAEVGIGSFRGN